MGTARSFAARVVITAVAVVAWLALVIVLSRA
jgi:hypothetical protein